MNPDRHDIDNNIVHTNPSFNYNQRINTEEKKLKNDITFTFDSQKCESPT